MIANLANVEKEVDIKLEIEKSNGQTSNLNIPNILSFEHINSQLPQYKPEVNADGSLMLFSGKRLPEQARRGWVHKEGRMVHQELGLREPNHLKRAYYTENNCFYKQGKPSKWQGRWMSILRNLCRTSSMLKEVCPS